MHSIHYIICLLVTVDFLEQLLNEVPVNSPLWRQIRQRVGLYRHVIHRDYLVPILGMNQLQSTDSWFDIFKAPALNDFQMMINSVYILIYKIAQYHVCMFTREFSLRCETLSHFLHGKRVVSETLCLCQCYLHE